MTDMTVAVKERRFDARIDEFTSDLLSQAASRLGVKVTPFVIEAAREKALRVLGQTDVVMMDDDIFDAMLQALDLPAEPAPALVALMHEAPIYARA
jgi:uncharacterized protein (DUF1778 family)